MKAHVFITGFLALLQFSDGNAGHLDQKWSGTVRINESCPMIVNTASNDRRYVHKNGQRVLEGERFQEISWQVDFQKYVWVEITDGNYVIGMNKGMFNIFGSYGSIDRLFQPTNSSTSCSWVLNSIGTIDYDGPSGTLSVDLGDDCSYTISLEGVRGVYEGAYDLLDDRSDESCGYVNAEGNIDKSFSDDAQTFEGTAADLNHIAGNKSTATSGGPPWYQDALAGLISKLRSQTSPAQAATISSVASFGSPVDFLTAKWNLTRDGDGFWAGTVVGKEVWDVEFTNVLPLSPPHIGNQTDVHTSHETIDWTIIIPEDGSAPHATATHHLEEQTVVTCGDAQIICRPGEVMPYRLDGTTTSTVDASSTLNSGIGIDVDTQSFAASHKAILYVHDFPPINERSVGAADYTEFDGCTGTQYIHAPWDFMAEFNIIGPIFFAPIDCQTIQGGESDGHRTYTWDLHYKDKTSASALKANGSSGLTVSATPQPLVLNGGTITMSFVDQVSSSNTVPAELPQGGTVFQTQATYSYNAAITNIGGASFQAFVQASEVSTNSSESTSAVVCSESDESSQTVVTNEVQTTVRTTTVGGVTNFVPAAVTAIVEGNEYRVHVEIWGPDNGSSETVRGVAVGENCAGAADSERRFASQRWTPGLKIVEVHGMVDPDNPTRLMGEQQMEQGLIRWDLQTTSSANLNLSVTYLGGDLVSLSWTMAEGVRLQQCEGLTNPEWQDVPYSQGTNHMVMSPAQCAAFFRLTGQ